MAIAPWASKGLIVGLGGISAVGIGGLAVKQGYFSKENKSTEGTTGESPGNPAPAKNESYLEKLGLPATCDLTSNACTLKKEDLNKLKFIFDSTKKGTPQIGTEVEAELTWEKTGRSGELEEFTFTIKAKTSDIDLGGSLSPISIPSTEPWMKFKVEEEENQGQKEYYLYLEHSSKELNAGMKCTNENCSKSVGTTNINGLDENDIVTKEMTREEEIKKYPGQYKYKVTNNSSDDKNGYYKLEFDDASKKWKLTKVDDLLSKWDESILTTGKWDVVHSTNNITVVISETDTTKNGNKQWVWQCEIKAKAGSSVTDLTSQLSYLKEKLGIEPKTDNQNIKDQRRKFVENCARNRDDANKANAKKESLEGDNENDNQKLEGSITLETEGDGEAKKLKETDFQKLFTEKVD